MFGIVVGIAQMASMQYGKYFDNGEGAADMNGRSCKRHVENSSAQGGRMVRSAVLHGHFAFAAIRQD
jgi:hypothetical protein